MTSFMTEDFLLDTEFARRLYHDYAKDQPIFDYHCHLPPQQVAENYRFKNLYDIWLKGDHYKWRAMRTNGVPERLCTGDASDREKFDAWAATVPHTIGNPLYHWTHLELRRPFGITGKLLSPSTADEIWDQCNDLLAQDAFSARGIMKQMNVKMVGPTDDPIDSLEHHAAVAKDNSFDIKVLPSWMTFWRAAWLARPLANTKWRSSKPRCWYSSAQSMPVAAGSSSTTLARCVTTTSVSSNC